MTPPYRRGYSHVWRAATRCMAAIPSEDEWSEQCEVGAIQDLVGGESSGRPAPIAIRYAGHGNVLPPPPSPPPEDFPGGDWEAWREARIALWREQHPEPVAPIPLNLDEIVARIAAIELADAEYHRRLLQSSR